MYAIASDNNVQVFAKCLDVNQTKLSARGIFLDMTGDRYPHSRNRWLPWLLERGLCDPETAAEYVGRKLLSPEAFAQARKEYQRATANYAPPYHAGFTLRKPDERALLEIWHIGYGPNVSYGLCVTHPNLY